MLDRTTIKGELEIDHHRGVIYFHADLEGQEGTAPTPLRIWGLPRPVPDVLLGGDTLDIGHPTNSNWHGG